MEQKTPQEGQCINEMNASAMREKNYLEHKSTEQTRTHAHTHSITKYENIIELK